MVAMRCSEDPDPLNLKGEKKKKKPPIYSENNNKYHWSVDKIKNRMSRRIIKFVNLLSVRLNGFLPYFLNIYASVIPNITTNELRANVTVHPIFWYNVPSRRFGIFWRKIILYFFMVQKRKKEITSIFILNLLLTIQVQQLCQFQE